MNALRQFCTFRLDDQCFGIDVLNVQEIIRPQAMTRVPLAHPIVRGVINLRGQIVTAIDLRERLELPRRATDQPSLNVVIPTDDGAVSILVDDVGDVLELSDEDFEPAPETLSGPARQLIIGAYKLPGRLLLILDHQRAVSLPD